MKNCYRELGLGLVLAGLGLVPTGYLILNSVSIIALGMALLILGAVCPWHWQEPSHAFRLKWVGLLWKLAWRT